MSRAERRVLVALTGALLGIGLVGALLVLGGASAGQLDAVFGPLLAALAALVAVRLMPRREPVKARRPEDDRRR